MTQPERRRLWERIRAGVGVAALHILLGYALLTGLGVEMTRQLAEDLKIFDVPPSIPPPVPEPPRPAEARAPDPEGAAAPPNLTARPSPVVAPPPEIRLDIPPPVIAAPVPTPIEGSDPSAGAADVKGPGTGSGGQGTGTGSGNAGGGTGGGGGGGARAQLVRGRLMNEDYPRSALRAGIQGSVSVRFTVDTDGVARDCLVTRSSGNADLDTTTCRLIERRFRYRAARDAQGKPVPETIGKTYDWLLPLRR